MDDTPGSSAAPAAPAWRTSLNVEAQEAEHYLDYWNEGLLRLIERAPSRVLELGCATGALGVKLKERYPGVFVAGIEANPSAAAKAAQRIDHVSCSRLEAVDFGAAPGGGNFDLVIAGDILEHLVDPWGLLVGLHACLAPGAALVASIPNVRNLSLIANLLHGGRWEYKERGLLDVTHLRFFAFDDMREMFQDTGYAVEAVSITLSPMLTTLYHEHSGKASTTVRLGRITLEDVTPRELTELCAEQFVLRLRAVPGAATPGTAAAR